ncbi:hypothetical protein C0Q70_19393 [Pomacea canaliculata]|uniref:CCHC-type domain-containing protein n=1 Tax=Pomacea canaliculata TaxID=400727 RepID=A0A2T7NJ73_POMCA|nr:hypothetical protein C0Q70_19393 [Pomacea canaliculata]
MPSLYSQIVTGGNDTTSATRPPGGFIPLSEVVVVSFTLNDEHIDDLLKRSTFQLHLSGRHALLTRREAIVAVLIASGTEREEDGSDKGTRYLKVEMQRKNMGKIPTMIAVPGHTPNMLVTVKGRASTCLVCGRPGHTRRDCPDVRKQYRPATGPTGHSKTTPGRDDKGPSTTPTLTVLGKVQAKPAWRAQNPANQPDESTLDLRPSQPRKPAPPPPPHLPLHHLHPHRSPLPRQTPARKAPLQHPKKRHQRGPRGALCLKGLPLQPSPQARQAIARRAPPHAPKKRHQRSSRGVLCLKGLTSTT